MAPVRSAFLSPAALAQPSLPEEVRKVGIVVNRVSNSILLVYNFTSEYAANPCSLETLSGLLDQRLTDPLRRVPGD
jgi:HAE1 family hydrophobic/amphiphilic exporter-1